VVFANDKNTAETTAATTANTENYSNEGASV